MLSRIPWIKEGVEDFIGVSLMFQQMGTKKIPSGGKLKPSISDSSSDYLFPSCLQRPRLFHFPRVFQLSRFFFPWNKSSLTKVLKPVFTLESPRVDLQSRALPPFTDGGIVSRGKPLVTRALNTGLFSSCSNGFPVLVCFSVAMIKYWPRATWGGKNLFSLQVDSPSRRDGC